MKKPKILIVDDEPCVLKFIADNLRRYNLTLETSSLKAVEIVKKEQFDIFIVDYQMPRVNGIELLEEIKQVYLGRHYMSIFCTEHETIHLFKIELVEGVYDFYVEKPINSDVMRETVQRSLVMLERIRSIENQPGAGLC